jgi:transitional endoplasmic reticulum ATPase
MFSLELYIKSMLLMPPFLLHNKKTISFSAMVATIMDKSQESYLGQQLQQANQALEAAAKEVNTSKEQAFQYYSDVETAVQDVELTIHTLVQNRIDQVLTQARKECIGLGLSLRPLFINQKFVIMLWIGLILVIPFLIGFLISSKFLGYLIAIGLYVFLSKKVYKSLLPKKPKHN